MCRNKTCPLAWRDSRLLEVLCDDLSDHGVNDLLEFQVPAGLLIYDVCTLLGFDPFDVLPADTVAKIRGRQAARLWPTLTEAEDAELVDLANIREPVISDRISPITDAEIAGVFP